MDYMPDPVEIQRREQLAMGPTCTCGHRACEHAARGTGECLRLVSQDPYKPCECKKPDYVLRKKK